MKKIILLLATLAFALSAHAQRTCTKADEANAQKAIDRVTSWPTLNSTWKSYRHCDAGAVGEQFTEALLRLIIDWKNMNQLSEAMARDADYKAFIVAHLKSKEAEADVPDVYSRAKANCPRGMDVFCKEIANTVHEPPPPPPPPPPAPVAAPAPATAAPPAPAPAAPGKK